MWRRVQVTGDTTLHQLHWILLTSMGWNGGHGHEFLIDGKYYGNPWPEIEEEFGYELIDEGKVNLSDVVLGEKTKFKYIYDLGDDWNHEISVEKILACQRDVQYPVCVAGKRSCPPEDCGGPWGYEELLEAITDPSHEDHEHMLEWVGEDFDPDRFDLEEINLRLKPRARKQNWTWA